MNEARCCLECKSPLVSVTDHEALFRCPDCERTWKLVGGQLAIEPLPDAPGGVKQFLFYTLSIPERAVRSTIGLAGGLTREATALLVPQAFQTSKTYEVVVRKSLNFLVEDIGGVKKSEEAGDGKTDEDFLARKAVGNFVDFAGLATLHVSPLWLLAIVSDVAYGTKSYVKEFAEELQKRGVIDETSSIHNIDDVLEAIQNSSGSAADLFDTPPISVEELKASLAETRAAISSANYQQVLPEAELKKYWEEMRTIAKQEEISLLEVSSAMTMHSLGKMRTITGATLAGVQVAGTLFNRHVIGHYAVALSDIQQRGFYATVQDVSSPYIQAVWTNFAATNPTITDEIVSGRVITKLFGKMKGLFKRSPEKPEATTE